MLRRDLVVGGALIALGILLLFRQILDIDLGLVAWPLFIVLPGIVLFLLALAGRGRWGDWLAVPGSLLTVTGALLFYQEQTGLWETWAYAWALIFPTSIGLGLMASGWLAGRRGAVATGSRLAATGFLLFLLGAAFFEGVLGLSGLDLGQLGRVGLPAVIIAFGVFLLVTNGVFRRRSA